MRLRVALLAVTLVAGIGGSAIGVDSASASSASAPAIAHGGSAIVLGGSTTRQMSVVARRDAHPERHVERPVAPRRSQRLDAGCSPSPGASESGRLAGEGIVSLAMAAPRTSWGSSINISVDVDVTVDGGTSQQFVLFEGGQPAVYQGYVGSLRTGEHCVTVTVDSTRSDELVPGWVALYGVHLGVVPRSAPAYLGITHAPVMYGRTSSAQRDAQLITDFTESPDADGKDVDLSYTVIWTREDVGDGIVPAYEWGVWGRMTDIETVLQEVVRPSGKVVKAAYLSCGCEKFPLYPDALPAPPIDSEYDAPYPASGTPPAMADHLVIRDATGNNDISPYRTSRYRFQQVPVTGPQPGQAREVVMDQHPWTYRISNQDVARTSVGSTNPRLPLAGNYPQYLIVDINAVAARTGSIAVGVQLSGESTWWTNDYAQVAGVPTTFPFFTGGHGRTVIKLPPDWHSKKITALRLVLNGQRGRAAPTLVGKPTIQLIEVTKGYQVRIRRDPRLTVDTGVQLSPSLPI